MFKNPFNKASDKPEERPIPEDAVGKTFITGRVLHGLAKHEQKDQRWYYGAVYHDFGKNGGVDQYSINFYSYSVRNKIISTTCLDVVTSLEEAIREIATAERDRATDARCVPVPGLEGNYRDFAAKAGGYFDEKDNFVSVKGDATLTKDVFLSRGELEKMYKADDAPAPVAKEPPISTWKDYYREVVRKYPLGKTILIGEVSLKTVKILEQQLMDENLSCSHKKRLLENIQYIDVDPAIAPRRSYYHYNVMVMTALLRAGGKAYGDFASSTSVNPETLRFLSLMKDTIEFFAPLLVKVLPAQAKQMANIIAQGPDPYASQPLPLEKAFMKKPAAAKPVVGKSHSP
jgi:hypothetical protein